MTDATAANTQRTLGLAVRKLRDTAKMTQEELAGKTGTHPTYISDIERGARNPSWAALVKLAGGMGFGMADLGKAFDDLLPAHIEPRDAER